MEAPGFTLMHHRCIIVIVKHLQKEIQASINKVRPEQMDLFINGDEKLQFEIPLRDFGIPKTHYNDIKNAIVKMATIPVVLPTKHPITGEDAYHISGLFEAIIPGKWSKSILILMKREIALSFIDVRMGFTKYMYEVAMGAKSKYTLIMYTLISHWRDRGGFQMTLENFRKHFDVVNKYPRFDELYRRVIRIAYEELHQDADVWFEVDFRKGNDNKVKTLVFKVIKERLTAAEEKELNIMKNQMEVTLKTEFPDLTKTDLKDIFSTLTNANYKTAMEKLMKVIVYIRINSDKIKNKTKYLVKAYIENMNEFEMFDSDNYDNSPVSYAEFLYK